MYDPQYTRTFYNACGENEWHRLEKTAYGRLQGIIHTDWLNYYVKKGDKVLDAGSGPGRFSIAAAQLGARVTVLDISDKQIEIAHRKIHETGLIGNIARFIQGDISDLSEISDNSFDVVICYGGALSYVCEQRVKAAAELVRVTRPGGVLLISVMSLLGSLLGVTRTPDMYTLQAPEKANPGVPGLWKSLETGDLPGFPSRIGMQHAPMHLFTVEELAGLFKGQEILKIAGSNVSVREASTSAEQIAVDPQAWKTLVEFERRINTNPGLVNSGSHIMIAVKRKERTVLPTTRIRMTP